MSTLTVGSGKMYARLSDAISASKSGDVIQVQAGTYTNDTASINHKLTIQGVGGLAHLQTTGNIGNGKGILVANADLTLDHIEFSGATVADANGAGVRYQAGNLSIQNCYFHDNQNGILANPSATGTINITGSEFAHNGSGTGYTHGIYVGDIAKLTVTNSYFHDTSVGHHIKSRAEVTDITNNRIIDGDGGTASYSIDVPNGGATTIRGNTIVQSATSQNPAIVAYGEEGGLHANSTLAVTGNTIENFNAKSTGVMNASTVQAVVSNNSTYNLGTLLSGPGGVSGTSTLSKPVSLDTSSPWQSTALDPVDHGATTITVNASGSLAGGVNAHFKLLVDGQKIGEATVGTTDKPYSFTADLSAGQGHKIQVQYDNDTVINGQDRSLIVSKLAINGHTVSPTDSIVSYDRGALDGRDVVKGQSGMWWNGTLVVNADKSFFPTSASTASLASDGQQDVYQHLVGQQTAASAPVAEPAASLAQDPVADVIGHGAAHTLDVSHADAAWMHHLDVAG
ncbi:carbohydrate-binding domain-containing protein [Azospirillum sp. A1-3]|uniref:carbohydrate-binding domain-containing protein n=1 Tax=Azospirillum sp. A1-3 TaxID=185874 RepID=UPI00336BD1B3